MPAPLSNEPESDGSSMVGSRSLTESLPFVDHPRVLLLSFPRSPQLSFLRDVGCTSQRCPSSFSWGYRPGWSWEGTRTQTGHGPALHPYWCSRHWGSGPERKTEAHPGARGPPVDQTWSEPFCWTLRKEDAAQATTGVGLPCSGLQASNGVTRVQASW